MYFMGFLIYVFWKTILYKFTLLNLEYPVKRKEVGMITNYDNNFT